MRLIIAISLFFLTLQSFAATTQPTRNLRFTRYDNAETVQRVFAIDNSTTYRLVTGTSSSADAFASKTNKYAEAKVVRIVPVGFGVNVSWGDSGMVGATMLDFFVPAGVEQLFAVDSDRPYLRVFGATAGAQVFVTEIK